MPHISNGLCPCHPAELENRDSLGLLTLLEARRRVEDNPAASQSRDLVWAGWHAALEGRLLQVVGHDNGRPAKTIVFSPDATQLFTTDYYSRQGLLWDTSTGARIGPEVRDSGGVFAVTFDNDGRLNVAGNGYLRLQLDANTGQLLGSGIRIGDESWNLCASTADGKSIAYLLNGNLHILNATSAVLRAPVISGRNLQPVPCRFSQDGSVLAIRGPPDGEQSTILLFDATTGEPRCDAIRLLGDVYCLAFSPDGKRLATGCWESHEARIWDATDGSSLSPPMTHTEDVHAVEFSPDGKRIATASFDAKVRVWDSSRKSEKPIFTCSHDGPVTSLAFQPHSGKRLATGSRDTTARIWNTETGEAVDWPFRHQGTVTSVVFSEQGDLLATASVDGTVRIWNTAGRDLIERSTQRVIPPTAVRSSRASAEFIPSSGYVLRHANRVWSVAVSEPNGEFLAVACSDESAGVGEVQVWSTDYWEVITSWKFPKPVYAIAFCPGTCWLGVGTKSLRIYDVVMKDVKLEIPGNFDDTRALAFSRDGKLLATTSAGDADIPYAVQIWSIPDGKPYPWPMRHKEPMQHKQRIEYVAFTPDGSFVVSAGDDKRAIIWNVKTGQDHSLSDRATGALAVSPGGELAIVEGENTIRFLNLADRTATRRTWRMPRRVQNLTFGPSSSLFANLLATASADFTAGLWDLATGVRCGPPLAHDQFVSCVAFDPRGRWIATGSFDKTVRIWPLFKLPQDINEMQLSTWLALGAKRDEFGHDQAIEWQEWQRLRAR